MLAFLDTHLVVNDKLDLLGYVVGHGCGCCCCVSGYDPGSPNTNTRTRDLTENKHREVISFDVDRLSATAPVLGSSKEPT